MVTLKLEIHVSHWHGVTTLCFRCRSKVNSQDKIAFREDLEGNRLHGQWKQVEELQAFAGRDRPGPWSVECSPGSQWPCQSHIHWSGLILYPHRRQTVWRHKTLLFEKLRAFAINGKFEGLIVTFNLNLKLYLEVAGKVMACPPEQLNLVLRVPSLIRSFR